MGKLLEQSIKSLFNGVSRQPDTVRLPSQVEEADNVLMSVVSGGFSRRPAGRHVAKLTGLTAGTAYVNHAIDRSPTEKFQVIVGSGVIKVINALTGVEHTVTVVSGALPYLTASDPLSDFTFLSIADYTFLVNRTVTAAMEAATTGTIAGRHATFNDLPASGASGEIREVTGEATTLDNYFVKYNTTNSTWEECADPNGKNTFNAATLPHVLVRTGTTTWDFKKATWNPRAVGSITTIPEPKFIGRTINDITYYKNRIAVLADEGVTFTQSGDLFNFWPDKATEVLDSDPVDVAASTNAVTTLQFAVPFRNSLFIQSENAQFEVSQTDRLTPKTASIELATRYKASKNCRPTSLGDTLYFSSEDGNSSIVFEYYYDDASISNTAANITKHCEGYIPKNITQFATEPASGTLFAVTDAEGYEDTVFVYRTYSDGEKKAQSAWKKWTFGADATIRGITVLDFKLYMIVERGSDVFLESVAVEDGAEDALGFDVKLDRKTDVLGVYDAGNDWTTWTSPYAHGSNLVVVLSNSFAVGKRGSTKTVTYPTSTTFRLVGDWTAGNVHIGKRFTSSVVLSKQYPRDTDQSTIISGRLQIRYMTLAYKDSGFFNVFVTPSFRDQRTNAFTGRVLGSGNNLIGSLAIEDRGAFRFPVLTRGDTATVEVNSDSILPFTIVSASWVGFFNEISRQG